MEALMQVLESTMAARDPYTVDHQRRVSQMACTIGREMGLSENRLRDLRIAGTLHDLGKFAIPADLLSKPGKLSHPEFALVKTHPQVAYNILEPISLPGNTAEIILQHHERLNGSGYPRGLKGGEILLEAMILGVADVMEAMSSHRPYRVCLGLAETMDELTSNKGILYDAGVVDVCLKLYGHDQPASRQVNASPQPLRVVMPTPLNPPGNGAWAPEIFPEVRAWPQTAVGKTLRWATRRPLGQRSWMQLGSASVVGWLIMASFKGW
jgi:HD-GYP domain-containing protein (c-di-GMP phosphodiesterase class II)